jgi:hypothetical protein
MKTLMTLILAFFVISTAQAQFPSSVIEITAEANKTVKVSGNLNQGEEMQDLSWAWNSSVACFPATQKNKFTGEHVLFYTALPPHSIMKIKLIPKDKTKNLSLYGYQIGQGESDLVPQLSSCVSCEADYKWDYQKAGKTQDHTRNISFNAIENSYTVVIGVAGADGLNAADFDLEVFLETTVKTEGEQQPVKMYSATSEKGQTKAYKGNLADGTPLLDLSWAWKSSVACFPGTQVKKFTGNHILFITEIPKYSNMEIELIPDDKNANMSLYAYEVGVNSNEIVPDLNSCVSCEADYKWDYPKKGKTQNHTRKVSLNAINNPYKVVIGVAGADGLDKGTFIIRIKLDGK